MAPVWWAVYQTYGYPWSVQRTRKKAITEVIARSGHDWKTLQRFGFVAVPCVLGIGAFAQLDNVRRQVRALTEHGDAA